MNAPHTLDDMAWSPLFAGVLAAAPQCSLVAPLVLQEPLHCPAPHRQVDALVDTAWQIVASRPDGLILRDGPSNRWSEETLWSPGRTPGRTYAILVDGVEYEFRAQLATWNPYARDQRKTKIHRRPRAA
jgi:hypothetical protein